MTTSLKTNYFQHSSCPLPGTSDSVQERKEGKKLVWFHFELKNTSAGELKRLDLKTIRKDIKYAITFEPTSRITRLLLHYNQSTEIAIDMELC